MKEMTWTRDEALKRLASMFNGVKGAMEGLAIEAVTAPDNRLRDRLFEKACEKRDVMVGILMSAEVLGIDRNEITDLEISKEEAQSFVEDFHEDVAKRAQKEMERDMPSGLKDILSGLFG